MLRNLVEFQENPVNAEELPWESRKIKVDFSKIPQMGVWIRLETSGKWSNSGHGGVNKSGMNVRCEFLSHILCRWSTYNNCGVFFVQPSKSLEGHTEQTPSRVYARMSILYQYTCSFMYIYTFLPLRGALQKWNHQPVEAIHAIGSITCCNHWAGRFNPHSLSLVVKANPIFIAKTVAVNPCWPNNQPFWNMVWSVIPLMNGKSSSVYFLIGLPHPFFRWLFHEINQPAIGVPPFMENPKCQWW
jgi:hypothetical protein